MCVMLNLQVAFQSSSTLSNLTILHKVPEGHVGVYWRGGAHHEINQFCSAHSLQQVYIDMFDQVSN